jgi:hypothetical protein
MSIFLPQVADGTTFALKIASCFFAQIFDSDGKLRLSHKFANYCGNNNYSGVDQPASAPGSPTRQLFWIGELVFLAQYLHHS